MEMVGLLGALLLWSWGFTATVQAQPATLTLACKGTIGLTADDRQPISMGIIVNFTDRTVQGFGYPGMIDIPVSIKAANEVTVTFSGSQLILYGQTTLSGSINRVTGDVEAELMSANPSSGEMRTVMNYELQCRPAQRMF
jgi:hypothetical protein